jgi:soluble lytic murein transglycosylase-like protein
MPDSMMYRSRFLFRIGLAMIAIWAIPASLWGQNALLTQHAQSTADQLFAGYDDSLTRAAETLLASATQAQSSPVGKERPYETPTESLAIHSDRRPQLWSDRLRIEAARPEVRLEMLRPVVEPILQRYGVPTELAAVILVESGGRMDALSPKGARGLWQIMPDTARRYGLRVDDMQDDRLDLFRATDAAARYLSDLYAEFGDWKFALAAYNTGEANVGSAIRKAHSQDFDQLTRLGMLPLETRNYVPRVLAATQSTGQLSAIENGGHATSAKMVFAVSNH